MQRSGERILTTHVGALPGPHEMWQSGTAVSDPKLRAAVADIVAAQTHAGIDIVNEGELTKGGNWVQFINARLSGFEPRPPGIMASLLTASDDWREFDDFYKAAMDGGTLFEQTRRAPDQMAGRTTVDWACTGAVKYVGEAALRREIDALRAGLGDHPPSAAFLTSTAPASVEVGRKNEHYKTDEEFLFALADALKVEYKAIARAGFLVQVDDAWLAALWDRIGVTMGLPAYKRYCMLRVEALNHALSDIPPQQVRYHMCWGSWHGPHKHDIPLADMIDVLLAINAGTYLIEGANARHEHEFALWEHVKLPKGKVLAPGVVTHSTPIVEHPELVSQRIQRFAKLVGPENVIASTDCGLGLRCHPQVAWAKLKSLSEGAALASKALGLKG